LQKIRQEPYKIPARLSDLAKNLIKFVLRKQHFERPTCEEILRHPWLLKHSSQQMNRLTGSFIESSTVERNDGMSAVNLLIAGSPSRLNLIRSIIATKSNCIESYEGCDDQVVPNL